MNYDKFFVFLLVIFVTIFAAHSSSNVFQFCADYFAGAAMCAALEYISED